MFPALLWSNFPFSAAHAKILSLLKIVQSFKKFAKIQKVRRSCGRHHEQKDSARLTAKLDLMQNLAKGPIKLVSKFTDPQKVRTSISTEEAEFCILPIVN